MWKKLNFDTKKSNTYFISFDLSNFNYEIYITDFVHLWFVIFKEEDFADCVKNSNRGLENVLHNELVKKSVEMLSEPEKLKSIDIKLESSTLQLTISKSFGYPVRLKIMLVQASKEMFFSKITKRLITTINDLKSSEHELQNLLQKKDSEIIEYRNEGAQILDCWKTKTFDLNSHKRSHNYFEKLFGNENLPQTLLDFEVNLPSEPGVKIKQEFQDTQDDMNQINLDSNMIIKQEIKSQVLVSPIKKRRKPKINF